MNCLIHVCLMCTGYTRLDEHDWTCTKQDALEHQVAQRHLLILHEAKMLSHLPEQVSVQPQAPLVLANFPREKPWSHSTQKEQQEANNLHLESWASCFHSLSSYWTATGESTWFPLSSSSRISFAAFTCRSCGPAWLTSGVHINHIKSPNFERLNLPLQSSDRHRIQRR